MARYQNPHLAVLGDRRAIGWVLTEQRIAFPEPRHRNLFPTFSSGDQLYLYTTRSAFGNPTNHRGRVIGRARVAADLAKNPEPLVIRNRELPYEAPIVIESLAPYREGVDLGEHVQELECFPNPEAWSIYLRRSVLALSQSDATLLDRLLKPIAGGLLDNIGEYQLLARTGVVAASESQPKLAPRPEPGSR